MKDMGIYSLPIKEQSKLQELLDKVKGYTENETKENLSLGTLDYLRKYRINR
ncbi:hypothetical protein NEIG_00969 [Nematocida sp. ERTm5]|nr:hypothetical protein NEIG_00969 [Nematocida sp. ERTm5]